MVKPQRPTLNHFLIRERNGRFEVSGNYLGTSDPMDWAWELAGVFLTLQEAEAYVSRKEGEERAYRTSIGEQPPQHLRKDS